MANDTIRAGTMTITKLGLAKPEAIVAKIQAVRVFQRADPTAVVRIKTNPKTSKEKGLRRRMVGL